MSRSMHLRASSWSASGAVTAENRLDEHIAMGRPPPIAERQAQCDRISVGIERLKRVLAEAGFP